MKIQLDELAKALAQSDVRQGYVDLAKGKVVVMADKDMAEEDILNHVFDIEDDWEHYIPLPNVVDGEEREVMQAFAEAQENAGTKERLLSALKGMGGTSRFLRQIRHLLLQKKWEAYLQQHFLAVARDWCEENAVEYEE